MEDIMTAKCRSAIKREFKDVKVDVVLHDGAPNVGTAWLQDAFGQNELTIHALRLATEFMSPGATFVTKAFRSQDYNALLFVFNQLFKRVEATKPQASRNESAEIFVVCQGFTAAKIDPKFLDPKFVFKEMEASDTPKVNVLQAKKGAKTRPEGYDMAGSMLLTRSIPVVEFVLGSAPVKALGEHNAFDWDETSEECQLWATLKATTPAIRDAMRDLKLLGKRDFRNLLSWRLKAAEAWRKKVAADKAGSGEAGEEDGEGEEGEEDPEEKLDEEISELERLSAQRKKALKKKEAEKRRKVKERLELKMEHPGDRLDVSEDFELFSLTKIKSAGALKRVGDGADPDELADDEPAEGGGASDDAESDEDMTGEAYLDRLDAELNAMYEDYQARTKRRAVAEIAQAQEDGPKSKKQRRREIAAAVETVEEDPEVTARRVAAQQFAGMDEEDLEGEDDEMSDDDDEEEEEGGAGGKKARARQGRNPLLVDVERGTKSQRAEASGAAESAWFGQSLFDGLADEDDDEEDIAAMAEAARTKRAKKQKGGKSAATDDAQELAAEADEGVATLSTPEPPKKGKAAKKATGAPRAEGGAPPAKDAGASSAIAAPFVKAATFAGARLGYVFKKGAKGVGYYADRLAATVASHTPLSLAQPLVKSAKRQRKEAATAASAAEAAASAVAVATDGAPSRKRKKGDKGAASLDQLMPDNAKFEDLVPEGGEKVVGGAAGAKASKGAQYDSGDDDEGLSHAESRQAAINRQAEAIVLGQMLLRPDKRRAIEDAAYNRHTSNDSGLPQWFLDDEKKYNQREGFGVDMDDNMLEKARNSLKDITAHTLGKVAEAKARKQRRLQRALTKVKKRAEAVAAKEDLSEREKAREIEKMYKKKIAPKKESKTLIVGRKYQGGSSGKMGHNVKLVDKRLRSDARAQKRADKNAKGKKGKHGGAGGGGRKGSKQKKNKQYARR